MKTEKQAKQEHKMQEKALKREKKSRDAQTVGRANEFEGGTVQGSSAAGRRSKRVAFAAKREEREARSLMISAKESAEILRRFGAGARKSEKKKKVREPFLATVEKVKAQSEESRKPRVAGAYSSPPPLTPMTTAELTRRKRKLKVSKEQVDVEEAAPTDEACSVCFHPQSIDEEFTPELATALQPASIKDLACRSRAACETNF
eukprot:g42682.t1